MEKLTSILVVVDRLEMGANLLEKAVTLARRFDARVELMLRDAADARAFAGLIAMWSYREVTLSIDARADAPVEVAVLEKVLDSCPDLVMKAPVGKHPLRRWSVDASDWRLAAECPVPLMLARGMPWAAAPRFAAAVDVADEEAAGLARAILHTAGFLTLGSCGDLDVLYSEREENDESLRLARATTLARLVREFHVGCERIQIVSGAPERTLPQLAARCQYDVVVLGAVTHRPSLMHTTLTSRIVDATAGDVVLVREAGEARASFREQRLDDREQRV